MRARPSFCYSKHHHPSASEAEYCNWLAARVQNREILSYRLYPSMPLVVNGNFWRTWKIDFEVVEMDGTLSYHESKGWNRSDDSFRLKRDVFRICYPSMPLYVNKTLWTGKRTKKSTRWRLQDVVRKNKRAAANRKKMDFQRKKYFIDKKKERRDGNG